MSEQAKVNILVVDDHRLCRTGLRLLIETNPTLNVAGECERFSDLARVIDDVRPDVTLLDLGIEDEDGVQKLSQLSEKTKVIVLTGASDPGVHESCLKSGANGLVSKEMAAEDLFDAIHTVANGDIWFDKALMGKVVRELTRPELKMSADVEKQRISTLSPREREVIGLVGEGLKNQRIADRLFISETTVRHHMTSILSKLDLSSRLELVVFAYRHGLATVPARAGRS